jgi:hypothetical protein
MYKLIRYLFHMRPQSKLPPLETSLVTTFNPAHSPEEIRLVLMTGRVRDEAGARALLDEYGVTTAADLLPLLPQAHPPVMKRLNRWLQLVEGAYGTDPHYDELREQPRPTFED